MAERSSSKTVTREARVQVPAAAVSFVLSTTMEMIANFEIEPRGDNSARPQTSHGNIVIVSSVNPCLKCASVRISCLFLRNKIFYNWSMSILTRNLLIIIVNTNAYSGLIQVPVEE